MLELLCFAQKHGFPDVIVESLAEATEVLPEHRLLDISDLSCVYRVYFIHYYSLQSSNYSIIHVSPTCAGFHKAIS